ECYRANWQRAHAGSGECRYRRGLHDRVVLDRKAEHDYVAGNCCRGDRAGGRDEVPSREGEEREQQNKNQRGPERVQKRGEGVRRTVEADLCADLGPGGTGVEELTVGSSAWPRR